MPKELILSLHDFLDDAIEAARHADEQKQMHEKIKFMIKMQSAMFEKSMAYTNVIILGGYAGVFTLLSITKDFLSRSSVILSVILLAISLVFFCSWEVAKMIFYSSYNRRIVPLLNLQQPPMQFFSELEKLRFHEQKQQLRFARWWYVILILTVLPGFGAGGILLYGYVRLLLGV